MSRATLLLVAGLVVALAGVAWLSLPAALILGGLGIAAGGLLLVEVNGGES